MNQIMTDTSLLYLLKVKILFKQLSKYFKVITLMLDFGMRNTIKNVIPLTKRPN